ncbi:cellulose synthase catalytic subunit [Alternaria sp. MG1]|nr:cellulose synthase catalytic subunit [Alternaria sp. MG1]
MARSQFGWTIMSTSKPATNGEGKSVSFALNFSPLLRLPAFWFSSKQKCLLEEVVNIPRPTIITQDDIEAIQWPICLACSPDNIENGVVILPTRGNEYSYRWDIIAFKMKLLSSGSPQDKNTVEIK